MHLDIPTLFTTIMIAYFCGSFILGLMAVTLKSIDRKIRSGWGWWSFAMLLSGTCAMLIGARGTISDVLSIVVANAILLLGFGIRPNAIALMNGKRMPYFWLPFIGTFGWLILYTMPWFRDDLWYRVLYVNSFCFLGTAICLWECWQLDRRQISSWFLIGAFTTDLIIRASLVGVHLQKQFPSLLDGYRTLPLQLCMLALLIAVVFKIFGLGVSVFELLKKQYQDQALLDPLTGLPNRRAFAAQVEDRLSRTRVKKAEYAVALIEIDGLMAIGERYGFSMQDACIRLLGKIASDALPGNALIGRLREGQVALFLPGASASEAGAVVKRISQRMASESRSASSRQLSATASVGMFFGEGTIAFDRAVEIADHCLKQAKSEGGNRIVTNDGLADGPIRAETIRAPFALRSRDVA